MHPLKPRPEASADSELKDAVQLPATRMHTNHARRTVGPPF